MAIVNYAYATGPDGKEINGVDYKVVIWEALGAGDEGKPYPFCGRYQDITIMMLGTPDGTTITVKGTNEPAASPTTWLDVHKASDGSTAISFTAAGADVCYENFHQMKPVEASGGGSMDVDVIMVLRR